MVALPALDLGLALCVAAGLVALCALWMLRRRPVMWMIGRLFVVAALAAGLMAAPLYYALQWANAEDGAVRAVIAATVVVVGWFVGVVVQELRRQKDREDRRTDLLVALAEEVFAAVEKFDEEDIVGNARRICQRLSSETAREPFVPFVFAESETTVYDSVSAELALLDGATLREVVRFYAAYSDLASLAKDLQAPSYGALSAARRWAAYRHYARQRMTVLYWALRALEAINRALGVEDPEAIKRSGKNAGITPHVVRLPPLPQEPS